MFAGKLKSQLDNLPKGPVNKIEIKKDDLENATTPVVGDANSIGISEKKSIKSAKVYKRRESNNRLKNGEFGQEQE